MAPDNINSNEVRIPLPASQCIPWLVVIITECLAIVILNIINIIVFVKQRLIQRRSTYLIIHLAIVDLLVGAVAGPPEIEMIGIRCDLWKFTGNSTTAPLKWALWHAFPVASLVNLAVISLERAHATFRPFKHRFIKKWVYRVIITVTWLTTAIILTVAVRISFFTSIDFKVVRILFFYFLLIILLVICVAYISIVIKVRFSRRPQFHGAAVVRERKLTSTLFIVTLVSLLAWLPSLVITGIIGVHPQLYYNPSSGSAYYHIDKTIGMLFFANSLVNPIIYAMRMPEVRAGILQIIFRRTPNRPNPVGLPLRNL